MHGLKATLTWETLKRRGFGFLILPYYVNVSQCSCRGVFLYYGFLFYGIGSISLRPMVSQALHV